MGLKNKSMYAILGILNLSSSTGYEIKKYSDKVLSGFWNENYGHIYPTLKILLADGMIEEEPKVCRNGTEEQKNSRSEKKIRYRITKQGQQELQQWLGEKTEQQPIRSEFLLKLLFSSSQPKEQVIQMLLDYQKQYESKLTGYREILEKLEQGDSDITGDRVRFLKAVLRRGILSDEAVLRWCEETIQEMQ